MSKSYIKVVPRFFVIVADEPKYLAGIELNSIYQKSGQIDVDGDFPEVLNTIFPQDLYLVFQESQKPEDFYTFLRPGMMLVFRGFQISCKMPEHSVIAVNRETGETHVAEPEFFFTYQSDEMMTSEGRAND